MVKIALVGGGKFGERHLTTLKRMTEEGICDLLAVVDTSQEQRVKLKKNYDCKVEALLENVLPEVDALDIVTPASTHYELAKQCLSAEKHVMIEKPMATSFAQAMEIYNLGVTKGKQVLVGHVFRYHKLTERMKGLIDSGIIGDPLLIEGQFLNPNESRKDVGAILNYSHFVDLCSYLLDAEAVSVECSVLMGRDTVFEDDGQMMIDYYGGVQVRLHLGWAGRRKIRDFVVEGSTATLIANYLDNSLEIVKGNASTGFERKVLNLEPSPATQPLYLELKDFVSHIESGGRPLADSYSGVASVYVCEKAVESAREHRRVECEIRTERSQVMKC